jgi:hypothetical protein
MSLEEESKSPAGHMEDLDSRERASGSETVEARAMACRESARGAGQAPFGAGERRSDRPRSPFTHYWRIVARIEGGGTGYDFEIVELVRSEP